MLNKKKKNFDFFNVNSQNVGRDINSYRKIRDNIQHHASCKRDLNEIENLLGNNHRRLNRRMENREIADNIGTISMWTVTIACLALMGTIGSGLLMINIAIPILVIFSAPVIGFFVYLSTYGLMNYMDKRTYKKLEIKKEKLKIETKITESASEEELISSITLQYSGHFQASDNNSNLTDSPQEKSDNYQMSNS